MAIQFPTNPVSNQIFVSGSKTYVWIESKQYWRCRATTLQNFNEPNTLSAYGITDSYTKSEVESLVNTGLQTISQTSGIQGIIGLQGIQGIIGLQGIQGISGSGSGGGTNTWLDYVLNWSSDPVFISTIAQGDVYQYTYNGSTAYRLIPTDNISIDSFYSSFTNSILGTLLAQRGNL